MPAATSPGTSSRRGSWPAQMTIVSTSSDLRLAIDGDVQPGVVDAHVLHSREHRDAAALEQRAADPAGGLGETGADLRVLALQQPQPARRRILLRGLEAAALRVAGVDAPLVAKRDDRRIVRRPVAQVTVGRVAGGEQFRHVEADAAGADERHARGPPCACRSTIST